MQDHRPTAIDLFSGVGGLSLGFERAGFDIKLAVDQHEWVVNAYARNFKTVTTLASDLLTTSAETLLNAAKVNEIDLIFGGPPCQGFSIAGSRKSDDERNLLLLRFAELVVEMRPKVFVAENVRGLLSSYSRPILNRFVGKLRRNGYSLHDTPTTIDARSVGVPQRRVRSFIVGTRRPLSGSPFPAPTCESPPTVRDAIDDLRVIGRTNSLRCVDLLPVSSLGPSSSFATRLRDLSTDAMLTGCMKTEHSAEIRARFRAVRQGEQEKISRYLRLAWTDASPTIRAGTYKERGSHTAPRPIHPSQARCITAREAARLHSYPDSFEFHGTRWHDFILIGNSVPPLLAEYVAVHVKTFFG